MIMETIADDAEQKSKATVECAQIKEIQKGKLEYRLPVGCALESTLGYPPLPPFGTMMCNQCGARNARVHSLTVNVGCSGDKKAVPRVRMIRWDQSVKNISTLSLTDVQHFCWVARCTDRSGSERGIRAF